MTTKTLQLTDELQSYLRGVSLREPALFESLRRETAQRSDARMQIAPEQGQLMYLLCRLMGVRNAIEVGVFTGYSSLWTAMALPPDGCLLACDVDGETTAIARDYWARAGLADRIDLRIAPALETLDAEVRAGHAGRFDFAFIDADKAGYEDYYERCMTLLRPGGLIVVDNTLWDGRVALEDVDDNSTVALQQFNAARLGDERIDLSLLPVADGLTLLRKR
jgi:predicted O-methyltransferase YrrM